MIPHRFRRQRADRQIQAKYVNQTIDDVRRLAITLPSPGFGAVGGGGGLFNLLNSTADMIGYVAEAITAREDPVPGQSSGDPVLGQGTAYRVGATTDDEGKATLKTSSEDALPVYNLTQIEIPSNTYALFRRMWDLWIVIPDGTDIYQAKTPTGGAPAASGASWPYTPSSFKSDVYALNGQPTRVAENAKIYNGIPDSLPGSRIALVKANGDGSFSVINVTCKAA